MLLIPEPRRQFTRRSEFGAFLFYIMSPRTARDT